MIRFNWQKVPPKDPLYDTKNTMTHPDTRRILVSYDDSDHRSVIMQYGTKREWLYLLYNLRLFVVLPPARTVRCEMADAWEDIDLTMI